MRFTVLLAFFGVCFLAFDDASSQTVGMSGNPSYAASSNAILDLDDVSGTKGLLVPRMTAAERGDITPSPTGFTALLTASDEGMTIYNKTSHRYEYWDGVRWQTLLPSSASGNTLDEAYNEGGNGVGRTINANFGAVNISGSDGLLVNANVGIGTNSAAQKLHLQVANSSGLSFPLLIRNSAAVNGSGTGSGIGFNNHNGDAGVKSAIYNERVSDFGLGKLHVLMSNTSSLAPVTLADARLTVLSNGNVGIGSTLPLQKLAVVGTGRFSSLAGLGDRVVYTNNNGDLVVSSSTANPNSLVDGSGTLNYLARWTPDGNTLGIGTTYDNGTNVGINTTSPGERLHVSGNLRLGGGTNGINSEDDDIRLHYGGVRSDDTSYEWVGFYSGTTRQGIILYDGAWSGANSLTDEFSVTAENGNRLTLNTNGNHISLMPGGSGNVGVSTTAPSQKLHVAGNELVTGDIYVNNASYSSLHYGNTGRLGAATGFNPDGTNNGLYAEGNNNGSEGGGMFMNGNTFAIWSPGDNDILKVYDEDDFAGGPKFRVDENFTDVNGYLTVGNPNTGSTVKKGSKTFVNGSTINIWNGTGDYNYYWNAGQLDLPPGASSITVKSITYNMTGYRRDTDESIGIYAKIGGSLAGWNLTSSWTFGGGGDQYYDWNFAQNLNWTFTSSQTVQFRLVEENETCFFCNNDYFSLYNIEVTVYYEYTTAPQAGTILAEGRIYANSTLEMGDMAEYFEVVDEDVQTGHLVSLIPGSENKYTMSNKGYDPYILGVISENPSVVLNSPEVGPPVALAGRVNVKLVSGMPLVKSGDFITSSPQAGLGMKARRAGTVVGYAVENQIEGQNYVEILLQPGRFYYPTFDNELEELPRQKFNGQ